MATKTIGAVPRIAIVYPYIALYAKGLLAELLRSTVLHADVFAGTSAGSTPLKVVQSCEEGGIQFKRLKNHWFLKKFLWQRGITSIALSSEYAVVWYPGNIYNVSTWIGALISRARGQKVLMRTHGVLSFEKGAKGSVRRFFYRLSHGLLLYERRPKELLTKEGFDPHRLYVTYNCLDYEPQKIVRSQLSLADDIRLKRSVFSDWTLPLVVFVGRLTPQKQLYLLVNAISHLHDEAYLINALIIGDGSEKKRLAEKALSLGIDEHIKFVGEAFSELSVGPWLHAADLCVSPGEVGLLVVHSFAYGTPVITHDDFDHQMPEVGAIVGNKTGNIFQTRFS
jgi:glycosyltransferase involved in cell wall biosynthesis